ncbi:glycosyl transferase [Ursidibacter arcticus]|uniref:glycosyltransferase family 2 protein n=1 Tax=Ursidibacter arcticus TaxID=1524965 RepID=UPI0012F93596|nr:glycosyltransferase family 2 protein [Ursidibacter arcticus]KAE9534199.1 glycosyl transferase [Ursidibacter arcticus]
MANSICAVVVTYNRKELLLNCLNALQNQTYPLDHIVVVNNASSDGTIDFLNENGWCDNDHLTIINLPENQGGAGGFYAGIEFAYQRNFDYIWLMDDDGQPSKNSLSALIPYINTDVYIGPLVLNINNSDELTFTLRLPKSSTILSTIDDVNKNTISNIIPDIVMPFNGILFSREMVSKIGLPKKEYFIWGDDMEYTWRAKKEGYKIFTVVESIFFHPKELTLGTPMFFNLMKFNDTDSKLKLYCMSRNNFRNLVDYKGSVIAILFIIKLCWFFLFTKPNLSKLKIGLKGIWHGVKGDFSHHREYL